MSPVNNVLKPTAGPQLQVSHFVGQEWGWESVFLKSSQVMLMLLV